MPEAFLVRLCSPSMTCNFRRTLLFSVSGADHGLDDNLVRHFVAVKEQFVFQLLAQAEEAELGSRGAHLRHFRLITFLEVQGLDLLNRAQVRAKYVLITEPGVS